MKFSIHNLRHSFKKKILEEVRQTNHEHEKKMMALLSSANHNAFPIHLSNVHGVHLDNFFDKSSAIPNTSIENHSGNLVSANGAFSSTFIRVKDIQLLGCNKKYQTGGAFYDVNFKYVTHLNGELMQTFEPNWFIFSPPKDAVYLRVVVNKMHLNSFMLLTTPNKPNQYYPYKVSIPGVRFPTSLQNKKIITFGDSITWQDRQTINGVKLKGYQSYIREAGAEVINEGVGNMSFAKNKKAGAEELYLYKKIVIERYDLTGVDIVTIACGTNDVGFGVNLGEVGAINSITFDTTTSFGALRAILEYIRSNFPTVNIYLMTPLQNNKLDNMQKCQELADGIITIGGFYGVPVLDLFRYSGLSKFTFDTYTRDGLHPNNAGYALFSPQILKILT